MSELNTVSAPYSREWGPPSGTGTPWRCWSCRGDRPRGRGCPPSLRTPSSGWSGSGSRNQSNIALSQFQTRKAEWIKDLSSLFTLHLSKSCEPPGPQMSFSKELKTKPRISLNKTLRKDLASSEAQLCETGSYLDRMVPSAIQSSKLMFGGFASEMIPSIHWLRRNSRSRSRCGNKTNIYRHFYVDI